MSKHWVDQYIYRYDALQQSMMERVRCIIQQSVPEVEEKYTYQCPFYYLYHKPFCYMAVPAHSKQVVIGFCEGYLLEDPAGLFNTDTKQIRKITFTRIEQINDVPLKEYLLRAVALHHKLFSAKQRTHH